VRTVPLLTRRHRARREQNLRLTGALAKLDAQQLVSVGAPGTAGRFDGFRVNRENGSQHIYEVPADVASTKTIPVPAAFFRAGWHLVLTNEELATLLIVIEQTQRLRLVTRTGPDDVGIGLPESVRWAWYGLAGEAVHITA
jgi:hypothetical protein